MLGLESKFRIDRKTLIAMGALASAGTFLVGGYEFARSVSTSLFIEAYGADRLPYAMTAVPVVLGGLVYLYGLLLSKWGAKRALLVTTGFSIFVFLGCYAGFRAGFGIAAAVLYVYRQAYIVLIIEQYWSLINSTLTSAEAKVLNGPIVGAASIGPIVGGLFVNRLAVSIGSEQLLLVAAALLIPAAALSHIAYGLIGEPQPSEEEKAGKQGHVNLALLMRSRRLLVLLVVVGLTQVLSTVLSLRLYGLLETGIAVKDARTAFLGGFWSTVNAAAMAMQFLIAPLILRAVPLRWTHVGIPVLHIAVIAALMFHPTLQTAAAAFLIFKALDYSLFRAGKEILYIPLSFDARYRAKQVIDAFAYRFSKGLTGGALSMATYAFGSVSGTAYASVAWGAAAVWAVLAFPLTKED